MSQLNINTLGNLSGSEEVPIDDVIHGTARAWVNFDGTGTVSIRAEYNVEFITDNGTGDYTVLFENELPDANYSIVGSRNIGAVVPNTVSFHPSVLSLQTAGSCRMLSSSTSNGSTALSDADHCSVTIFR